MCSITTINIICAYEYFTFFGGTKLKICITAKGETLDSPVEERFGRAPVFIFFETESEEAIAVPNEFAQAAGGVGPQSAQVLVNNNATILITGQIGGNARRALEGAGIAVYQYGEGGSVRDALVRFKDDALQRLL